MSEANNWRLLLIDDDEDEYYLARSLLNQTKDRNIALDWAPTYEAGEEFLERDHYDAVLVDYDLGCQTGITLIRNSVARNYAAPLILYTGRGSYDIDVEAQEAGATLYLPKAEASPLSLERYIRYAIERKQSEIALRHTQEDLEKALAEAERRAEEAEEGKRILEAMMDCIPEGITIADAPDVNIRMVSKYGQELTGRQQEEIEHIPFQKHPENWQIYDLDGITLVPGERLPLSRATIHGEVVKNEELLLKRPSGEQINILCNAGPIRDGKGKITGGVIAWRDITDHKVAEDARKESEALLAYHATILETVHDAIIVASPDQVITYWNRGAEELYGYSTDEAVGRVASELLRSEWTNEERMQYIKCLIEDGYATAEVLHHTKEGNQISVEGSSRVVYDESGEVKEYVTAFRDITHRKRVDKKRQTILEG